ncbi:MAG: hypothetical protein K8U57_13755 [Planctomycetes bacterium]|nr:hypothetical protein [Planctomycetota bacterium]
MLNQTLLPLLLLALLGLIPVNADEKEKSPLPETPAPKLPLGKETTYVTGPLDKQGYVDYEAALNAELSRGITPAKNANVLLIAAFGPAPEGGTGLSLECYRWLDINAPPKDGEYFVSLTAYGKQRLALSDLQLETVFDQQTRATARPWSAKDYPVIAEWVKANDKPLGLVMEASKRPEYFSPICSNRAVGGPSNLIGGLLPTVSKCREAVSALNARAMLLVHEGKFDDAWNNILASHRLARLVSRGATLIEGLVGVAIGQSASNATVAYLEQSKLTSKQALERLKDLRNLPPFASFAEKVEIMERFSGLDALQSVRRGATGDLFGRVLTKEESKALEAIDWAPAMQTMNGWYDRIVAAMRLKERTAREKGLDKVEAELQALQKQVREVEDLLKLLVAKGGPDKATGKRLGDGLITLLSPSVRKVQAARDRAEQVERNLHIAFALAAYHADHGRYPETLDDLAPEYIPAIVGDLFSGKALIYKPGEKGYLFYSVGPNGKDDGGRWFDDAPPGDDPRVRMPLPPLKKN